MLPCLPDWMEPAAWPRAGSLTLLLAPLLT
jgi:hypothetical protein